MNRRRFSGLSAVFLILLLLFSGISAGVLQAKDIFEKSRSTAKETKPAASEKVSHSAASAAHEALSVTPEEALKRLMDGNKRYVSGKFDNKRKTSARREEISKAQHPFAIILSCSDSRVPPEVIFDQGLGDLFVIRTAGHVLDDVGLASIEYAVEHLGVKLIVVLGHKRCGAVDATVKGGEAPGQIGKLVEAIKPAVEKAKTKQGGELLDESIRANAKMVADKVRYSKPILYEPAADGVLKVVGAYYDLDSGVVSTIYKPCM